MNNKLLYILVAASILTACGGSDNSTSDVTPEENIAPVAVDDLGIAQDNQSVIFDVLENDIDGNNDNLTVEAITIAPQNGTALINDNKIMYTANTDFVGKDTMIYRVSDGGLTSEASIDIIVNHTMTISGIVTDSPIANATVYISLGEHDFVAIADTEGRYELPIVINDFDDIVTLKALGHPDNNQANVELLSTLGGAKSLLDSIDAERKLTNEISNLTNITHVSTASYLLVKDRNNNQDVTSVEQLNKLRSEVSPEELLETAGFIKLLIDNSSFQIPDGKTLLSVLESTTGNTSEAIQAYLTDNNFIDESGETTEAFDLALEVAIAETVADPDVVEQFSQDMFAGKRIIELFGAREGWNEFRASGWSFNPDGTAMKFQNNYGGPIEKLSANWSINGGKLELEYHDLTPSFPFISYPFNSLVSTYGFDYSVQVALMQATEAGLIDYDFQVELQQGLTKQTATLLTSNEANYQVSLSGEYVYKLIMPIGMNWQGNMPVSTMDIYSTASYSYNRESLFNDKTIDEVVGSWVMNFDYLAQIYVSEDHVDVFWADKVEITTLSAIADRSGYEFSSTLDEGTFLMTEGDTSYRVTPFKQEGNNFLATTEKWVDGKLAFIVAGQIAKFDTSFKNFTDNLVTELPIAQLAFINGAIKNQWDGDKLKIENVWGYHFKVDGSLTRGISGHSEGYDYRDDIEGDHFHLGDDRWTWDKDANLVNLRMESDKERRHRTWEVLSMDEQGRTLVFEYSTRGYDYNGSGDITGSEQGVFIFPRINIVTKEDLSQWEDAWNNTVNAGNLSPYTNKPTKEAVVGKINFKTPARSIGLN